jgi:von Willebrand factor type A domain
LAIEGGHAYYGDVRRRPTAPLLLLLLLLLTPLGPGVASAGERGKASKAGKAHPRNTRPASRAAADQLRLAIVLDDSGSMKYADRDPRRLSITGAMIAVQLSGPADRVALVPLNGRPTALMPGGNPALLRKLTGLQRRGAETIYDRPLRRAFSLLGQQGKRLVLFLTDGEPEPRDPAQKEKAQQAQQAYLEQLARKPPPGVRFFPVVLGQVGERWTGLLQAAATATGGRLFKVQRADGLIDVFAGIYARMVGSKQVEKRLGAAGGEIAKLDDFVRYANLVIVSEDGRPFSVSYPDRRMGRGGRATNNGADRRTRGDPVEPAHHFVHKIPVRSVPAGQTLAVQLTGANRYRALLIYDYDLALHLDPPARRPDGSFGLRAYLTGRQGQRPVDREPFLKQTRVSWRLCQQGACTPQRRGQCRPQGRMVLKCGGAGQKPRCGFDATFAPDKPGSYCLDARAGKATLDLLSREVHRVEVGGRGKLNCGAKQLRFELDQDKTGNGVGDEAWRDCKRVPIRAPGLARPVQVELDTTGLGLPEHARLRVKGSKDNRFTVQPGAGANVEVCLEADELVDRPGFDKKALPLRFRTSETKWFGQGGCEISVPADVKIGARTWWNRNKCLLLGLALALAALLLLIWIIRGFVSPHPFQDNLKVNWGNSLKRLERNEMPISEIPGTGRGFYRNARLRIGGGRCFMESGWPSTARFEATGRRSISLLVEEGVTAERIDKFDTERMQPLQSGAPVSLDEVIKVNDLFFRLKL